MNSVENGKNKMKMSIMHITTFLQGGAGRVLIDLACSQKAEGHEVVVLTDNTPISGYESYPAYLQKLRVENIQVITLEAFFQREIHLNLCAAERVRDLLFKRKISVIHAHAAVPAMIGLIARSTINVEIPLIMTMQGFGQNKTEKQEKADISTMNMVDYLVPVSFSSHKELQDKGLHQSNIRIIHNSVSLAHHNNPISHNGDGIAIKLLKEKRKSTAIIGCIGTIGKRKNQECLLRALAGLKGTRFMCVLIGEEENEGSSLALISKLGLNGKVIITGYRNDAEELLRLFSCLVLPSNSEGLPLTVLEAFRERVPVIGSDIDAIKELITHGKNGYLFQRDNHLDLCEKIEHLLMGTEKMDMIKKSANDLFKQNYSLESMLSNYSQLYRDVCQLPHSL